MADNFTSEVNMGELPKEFYNNSIFNATSPFCKGKMFDYCTRKTSYRAISCSDEDVTISNFLKIHEDVAKLKHLIFAGKEAQEDENGYLFREGPRDSGKLTDINNTCNRKLGKLGGHIHRNKLDLIQPQSVRSTPLTG